VRDFALANGLAVHIGGGLGIANLNTRIKNNIFGNGTMFPPSLPINNPFGNEASFNSTRGAYQAGIGLDYATAIPGLKLFLDYRIFGFFKSSNNVTLPTACGVFPPAFSPVDCGDTTERVVLLVYDRQVDQSVVLGGRFSFGP
jgi:opacity protein-like surface antigen